MTVSAGGYIKRLPPDTFKVQSRGGKGLIGSEVADEDFLLAFLQCEHARQRVVLYRPRPRVPDEGL